MLGGILFVIIVWFVPILIWYFVQGRKEFEQDPSCDSGKSEQQMSKRMFFGALGFGVLIILLIVLLA